VFGSDQEVAELMKAVKRMNATGHFNWIGSDGWSARALVSEGKTSCSSVHLSVHMSVCLSFCLHTHLSVCLPICLSVYPSVCLSVC
jgi:hypothetical protein